MLNVSIAKYSKRADNWLNISYKVNVQVCRWFSDLFCCSEGNYSISRAVVVAFNLQAGGTVIKSTAQ